jgi:uncharacterized membrane protein YoaK (UPF0700 family)
LEWSEFKLIMLTYIQRNAKFMQSMFFGMILTMAGGFMDVYSYMVHGGVFATGQTGNFVLVGVYLIQKDYKQMIHALIPILSFWLGVFIALHLYYFLKEKVPLWNKGILVLEVLVLFTAGLLPSSFPDMAANILVSFAASLQFCTFRTFGKGDNYSSVFCTGNMRSCAENYYKWLVRKETKSKRSAIGYSIILISFFTGVAIGGLSSKFLQEKAIWIIALLLLGVLIPPFVSERIAAKNASALAKKGENQIP